MKKLLYLIPLLLLVPLLVIAQSEDDSSNEAEREEAPPGESEAPPGEGGPSDAPPSPVITAEVEEGSYSQDIRLTGNVEAMRFSILAAEQAGIVEQLLAEEGDFVTTGTPLMQLRQKPLRLEYQELDAQAASDRARLAELLAGTREEDIAIAEAELEQVEAELELAGLDVERYSELAEEGSVSQELYDQTASRYKRLQAQKKSAEAALERARNGPREETILQARADADSSLAEAQAALDDLDRATLRAPYAGVITREYVDAGSWVSRGEAVFDIEEIDTVQVRINVPEVYFSRVDHGTELEMTFDGAPGKSFTGVVSQIIPRASEQSRAFPVLIDVENEEHTLAPGMLARVLLEPAVEEGQSIIVPKDALVAQGQQPIVYRVKESEAGPVAESVTVRLGRYYGEAVEVFGDLQDGDEVVIRGNERLQPGQKLLLNRFSNPSANSRQASGNETGM